MARWPKPGVRQRAVEPALPVSFRLELHGRTDRRGQPGTAPSHAPPHPSTQAGPVLGSLGPALPCPALPFQLPRPAQCSPKVAPGQACGAFSWARPCPLVGVCLGGLTRGMHLGDPRPEGVRGQGGVCAQTGMSPRKVPGHFAPGPRQQPLLPPLSPKHTHTSHTWKGGLR